MAGSDRETRVVSLLEDSVRTELQVVNGMQRLGLSDDVIERLMEGVTSGILYAFDVDWAPDWVGPGEVHAWQEGGAWRARCARCLTDSPPSKTMEEAASWAREHEIRH